MQIISSKAVKRDKAAEAALKKRQQARQMLERMKELEQVVFECSIEGLVNDRRIQTMVSKPGRQN